MPTDLNQRTIDHPQHYKARPNKQREIIVKTEITSDIVYKFTEINKAMDYCEYLLNTFGTPSQIFIDNVLYCEYEA